MSKTKKILKGIFIALHFLEIAVAGYLLVVYYNNNVAIGDPFCKQGSLFDCVKVAQSPYANFPPFIPISLPTALWGILTYTFMLIIYFSKRCTDELKNRILAVLYVFQVVFVVYLLLASYYGIGYFCPYCLVSNAIVLLGFIIFFTLIDWNWSYVNPIPLIRMIIKEKALKPMTLKLGTVFTLLVVGHIVTLNIIKATPVEAATIVSSPHLPGKADVNKYPVKGPKDASVRIIEYSDFGCPYCLKGAIYLDQAIRDYEDSVKLIFKPYPLDSCNPYVRRAFHPGACVMTYVAYKAYLKDPKKFWQFYDYVFDKSMSNWVSLVRLARSDLSKGNNYTTLKDELRRIWKDVLKLKEKDFNSIFTDSFITKANKWINESANEARRLGLRGVPLFLINNAKIEGAYPTYYLKKVIEDKLR